VSTSIADKSGKPFDLRRSHGSVRPSRLSRAPGGRART